MRILAVALAASALAPLAGCGWQPGYPPQAVPSPSQVLDFTALYNGNCAACHGRGGQNGPAIDLSNPEYQALVDDATLRKWIAGGMPGTQMPAFATEDGGMLTDAQVNVLIAGMRTRWLRPNAFAGSQPPPYAQVHAGDPHRGQQVYSARCAGCHASSPQQITAPVYLALVANQALRSIIIAGRPDIGQPDWRHDSSGEKPAPPLSAQQVDDIVTYLATLRNSAPAFAGTATDAQPAAGGETPGGKPHE